MKLHQKPKRKSLFSTIIQGLGKGPHLHLSGSGRVNYLPLPLFTGQFRCTKWRSYWEEELQNADTTPGDGVESNEVTWQIPEGFEVFFWGGGGELFKNNREIYWNRGLKKLILHSYQYQPRKIWWIVFTSIIKHNVTLSSWWFQPMWTMSQMESIFPGKGSKKNVRNHRCRSHPVGAVTHRQSILSLVLGALHGIAYK